MRTHLPEATVGELTIKRIEELDYYKGEHALPGIKFRYAAAALGVSAWGMNVLEVAPGVTDYPEHDHVSDGQEEVYVVLRGSATLRSGDVEHQVTEGTLVRVGPSLKRKFLAGPQGVTLLAIGATPGQAYAPRR